jgi:plasmid stabilization system protein ParE
LPKLQFALRVLDGIDRPVEDDLRELLISRGRTGYVALYRYNPMTSRVLVLRVRHQREVGLE